MEVAPRRRWSHDSVSKNQLQVIDYIDLFLLSPQLFLELQGVLRGRFETIHR